MVWGDIMTSFWPMCVITSAIARFIPIFKLEYFWNAKTYTDEILIWCHIDGVLSEKPQNTHNLNCLFFNGCLGWKFKNCWNDCVFLFHFLPVLYTVVNYPNICFTRLFLAQSAHKSNKNYNKIQNIWFPLPTYSVLQFPKNVVLLNFCLCVYMTRGNHFLWSLNNIIFI